MHDNSLIVPVFSNKTILKCTSLDSVLNIPLSLLCLLPLSRQVLKGGHEHPSNNLLLEGGITLISAITVASQAVPNKYLFNQMRIVPESIKNGESLSESLKKTEYFPHLALDMIRIGESSANLEGMLYDVAEVYDEGIRNRIDTIVSLIQPIIIIFMGLIVALMLLSVYLPIFNIIRVVQ